MNSLNSFGSVIDTPVTSFEISDLNSVIMNDKTSILSLTCLRDRNGGMKLQILTFIQALVETHPSEIIRPHVATVLPAVVACAKEDWYKIIAQSIRVVGCFVNVLRPISKDDGGRLTLSNYSCRWYVKYKIIVFFYKNSNHLILYFLYYYYIVYLTAKHKHV